MEQDKVDEIRADNEARYRALVGWTYWHTRSGEHGLAGLWNRWYMHLPLNMGSK